MKNNWTPASWRQYPVQHQPSYADSKSLDAALRTLRQLPELVAATEILALRQQLASVQSGAAMLLQGGDCAEAFAAAQPARILAQAALLQSMASQIQAAALQPVVQIGRIAGQYAKPRTDSTELLAGVQVPVYLGESINGIAADARQPQPERLLQAYQHSATTLAVLRAAQVPLFTSHEGLLLAAEEQQTRFNRERQLWFNHSAHFLWIGERTRGLGGAHVEYFRGIANPVGIKLGPQTVASELVALVRRLNPDNIPGKIVLISRMGSSSVSHLRPLILAVQAACLGVVWLCDPMHGNTFKLPSGRKTRAFSAILAEVRETQALHKHADSRLHGLHVEVACEELTECLGGRAGIETEQLEILNTSLCDPRLSASQGLELACAFAELIALDKRMLSTLRQQERVNASF